MSSDNFEAVEDLPDILVFFHMGRKFYRLERVKKYYYYVPQRKDSEYCYYYCSDYEEDNPKSCQACLIERLSDEMIDGDFEHKCGVHHYFIPGMPKFTPLYPPFALDENSSDFRLQPPSWLLNKVFHLTPAKINMKKVWVKHEFGKFFFSFVDWDQVKCPGYSPLTSKLNLRLSTKDESGNLLEDILLSNCGSIHQIVCVKRVTETDISQEERCRGANWVCVFKLPATSVPGVYEVELYINNSPFSCTSQLEFTEESLEETKELQVSLKDDLRADFRFMMLTNSTTHGNYMVDKVMNDLCKDKFFFTSEVTLRHIARSVRRKSDEFGVNLLIHAAARGWLEMAEFLLGERYEVDFTDSNGNTALFWAAAMGCQDVMDFLLKNGADETIVNSQGCSYEEFAQEYMGMITEGVFLDYNEMEPIYKAKNEVLKESLGESLARREELKDLVKKYGNKREVLSMFRYKQTLERSRKRRDNLKRDLLRVFSGSSLPQNEAGKKKSVQQPKSSPSRTGKEFVNRKKVPTNATQGVNRSEAKNVPKKKVRVAPAPVRKKKKKRGGVKNLFSIKGLKKLGRTVKNQKITQWTIDYILDWVESTYIFESNPLEKQELDIKRVFAGVESYDELGSIRDRPEFFQNVSPRRVKLFHLNLDYLQSCAESEKGAMQKKTTHFVILKKVARNGLVVDAEKDHIDKLASLLNNDNEELSKRFWRNAGLPNVAVRVLLCNDYYHSDSVKMLYDYLIDGKQINYMRFFSRKFVTGLLIGETYLEWNSSELVVPRNVPGSAEYIHIPVCELQRLKFETKRVEMAEFLVKWNRKQKFDIISCNGQHFIESLLKSVFDIKLDAEVNLTEHDHKYLEEVKRDGFNMGIPIERKLISSWDTNDCVQWCKFNKMDILHETFKQRKVTSLTLLSEADDNVPEEKKSFTSMLFNPEDRRRFCVGLYNLKALMATKRFYNISFASVVEKTKTIFTEEQRDDFSTMVKCLFPLVDETEFKKLYLSESFENVKKVEVIMTNLKFNDLDKITRNFIARENEFDNSAFGTFSPMVIVGSWLFFWNNSSIVVPLPLSEEQLSMFSSGVAFSCPQSREEILDSCARVCVEWNSYNTYSSFSQAQDLDGEGKGNSQKFVDALLGELELSPEIKREDRLINSSLNEARQYGKVSEWVIIPSERFCKYFKIDKFGSSELKKEEDGTYKIQFHGHSEVDEFVHYLLKTSNKKLKQLVEMFPSEFQMLKILDNEYWLRLEVNEGNEMYQQTAKIRTGCPFKL